MDDRITSWIDAERRRQRDLFNGDHAWGRGDCSSPGVLSIVKAAVLTEECGEVANAVLSKDDDAVRTELIHVAAVAVAWLEMMT